MGREGEKMKKCQVYDPRGRERWLPAGAIVPAGWYRWPGGGGVPEVLAEEGRVVLGEDQDGFPILIVRTPSELRAEEEEKAAERARAAERAAHPEPPPPEYRPRAGGPDTWGYAHGTDFEGGEW